MRTRSIIVNTHEAPALHSGEQTLILRPMKPQPEFLFCAAGELIYRYKGRQFCDRPGVPPLMVNRDRILDLAPYRPGDILAVRETWAVDAPLEQARREYEDALSGLGHGPYYRADKVHENTGLTWRSPATMPTWAVRTRLEVVDVRAMMVRELSWLDAAQTECPKKIQIDGDPRQWLMAEFEARYPALSWETAWVWAMRVKGA